MSGSAARAGDDVRAGSRDAPVLELGAEVGALVEAWAHARESLCRVGRDRGRSGARAGCRWRHAVPLERRVPIVN
jgi:hypothetical protein